MVRMCLWGLFALLLAGCAAASPGQAGELELSSGTAPEQPAEVKVTPTVPEAPPVMADLEDFGPAPELKNDVFLNIDRPVRLADFRGQVVLLDMWTFG